MSLASLLTVAALAVQDDGLQGTTVTSEALIEGLKAIPDREEWVPGLVSRFVAHGAAPEDVQVVEIPPPTERELLAYRQLLQGNLRDLGMGPIDVETIVLEETERLQRPAQNVALTVPGKTDRFLVIGAPFDAPEFGEGMIDNWSGGVMLAALSEACRGLGLRRELRFVAFGAEESGSRGSAFYVDGFEREEWSRCDGLLVLDSLGMAPPAAWDQGSSPGWYILAQVVSRRLEIPFQVQEYVDLDVQGADAMAFRRRGVPSMYLNGLDLQEAQVLHTAAETFDAIRPEEYTNLFRFVVAMLRLADRVDGSLKGKVVRESLPLQDEDLEVPLARYRLSGREGPRMIELTSIRTGPRIETPEPAGGARDGTEDG